MIYLVGFKKRFCWYKWKTYLPYLIRKIADVDYNHVGVVNTDEPEFIYEAIGKGVKKNHFIDVLKEHDDFAFFKSIEKTDINISIKRMDENLNKPYDYKALLLYQLILNIFKKWIGKEIQDDKFYCYEFAAYIFQKESAYKVVPKKFIEDFHLVYFDETNVDRYYTIINKWLK